MADDHGGDYDDTFGGFYTYLVAHHREGTDWRSLADFTFPDIPGAANLSKDAYLHALELKNGAEMNMKRLRYVRDGLKKLASSTSNTGLKTEEQQLRSEIIHANICLAGRKCRKDFIKSKVEEARNESEAANDALNAKFFEKRRTID